jgi:hypothetical protein
LSGNLPFGRKPGLGFAPPCQVAVWGKLWMFGEEPVQRIVAGTD